MKSTVGLTTISGNSALGDMVFSNICQFEYHSDTHRPSVKMVLSGAEHYKVNGHQYALESNRFLVVDKDSDVGLTIDDANGVSGVCIFPSSDLINDIALTKMADLNTLLDGHGKKADIRLMEQFCDFKQNRTGNFLSKHVDAILKQFQQGAMLELDDFYLGLAECMVDDQLQLESKISNLSSVRRATQEELYRRVSKARDYLESNYTEKINLDDLVANAYLSKFHFLRSFKAIYDQSPYQYLLQLRLQKAKELLRNDYSMNEVNHMVGFSDVKNLRRALSKAC